MPGPEGVNILFFKMLFAKTGLNDNLQILLKTNTSKLKLENLSLSLECIFVSHGCGILTTLF